jgi:calnexin
MKSLRLLSLILIISTVCAHDDDDFDDEVDVEEDDVIENVVANDVTVEKVEIDVSYFTPDDNVNFFFMDHFDDPGTLGSKWTKSQAKKDGTDDSIAKYDGVWAVESLVKDPLSGDSGLVLKSKAKHSAVSAKLKKPFTFAGDRVLVIQYEIAFQSGQECGGGYIKLLSEQPQLDLRQLTDKTPYTIMFGPDKCGSDSKFHFIFRHKNPKDGSIEEKHCKKVDGKGRSVLEEIFKDKKPHLLRLLVRPDNTFEVSIDHTLVNHGSLLDSFTPPVNPPAEIDDPEDFKPEDWDEREKIPDPEAVKPDDWDESAPKQILDEAAVKPDGWLDDEPDMVPDPDSVRPEDWDDEMDGDWEAPLINNPLCADASGCGPWSKPMIDNPDYKGKWFAPMINNPGYKGKWKPAKIPNPDYYHDDEPFKMTPIAGVGIELWTMSDNIYFDNLLITDDVSLADGFASETFDLKKQVLDAAGGNIFQRILAYSNKNPWLYAVYVVLVGLPTVLIITFCCSGNGDKSETSKSSLNDPKKTDEAQEDDEVVEEVAAAGEEEQEPEPDEEDAGSQDETEEVEEDGEDDEGDEEDADEPPTTRSQTRKRKPRKD